MKTPGEMVCIGVTGNKRVRVTEETYRMMILLIRLAVAC